jgi:hypothetical protein
VALDVGPLLNRPINRPSNEGSVCHSCHAGWRLLASPFENQARGHFFVKHWLDFSSLLPPWRSFAYHVSFPTKNTRTVNEHGTGRFSITCGRSYHHYWLQNLVRLKVEEIANVTSFAKHPVVSEREREALHSSPSSAETFNHFSACLSIFQFFFCLGT